MTYEGQHPHLDKHSPTAGCAGAEAIDQSSVACFLECHEAKDILHTTEILYKTSFMN